MPAKQVNIDEVFHPEFDRVILDVRSPAEYQKAHIPGAMNLPLFSDEERAIVGTAYKQESPEKAMVLGLDFAGQKMKYYIEQATLLAPAKKVYVHCWRGGKRSESMGWLLSMAGFDVQVLTGGYKKYRRSALDFFLEQKPKLIILGGRTGTGKTEILQHLAEAGEQIIDLEKLANHKGSAFGSLGEQPQPSVEHFENLLFEKYRNLDLTKRIFIENESPAIGKCKIPDDFYKKMKEYYYLECQIADEERIARLIKDYAHYPKEELKERFEKIRTKLGGDQLKLAIQYIDENNFAAAAAIALKYYDKTYFYGFVNKTPSNKTIIIFKHTDTSVMATEIIQTCNTLNI